MAPLSSSRRCLLCRHEASPVASSSKQKSASRMKSCATSMCTIFGLPDNHPFTAIYERAQYCNPCLKELQEADVALEKLELVKQSLLRFQNKVYSKLGDNYFQIANRDGLNANFVDFEKGGAAMKGRKFSYDEIVKVVYEKLDKDCLKWERFSSEGQLQVSQESNTCTSSSTSKTDSSSQTENLDGGSTPIKKSQPLTLSSTPTTTIRTDKPLVVIPDINDDTAWGVGSGAGACEEADDHFDDGGDDRVGSDLEQVPSSVGGGSHDFFGGGISADLPPEAAGLFTRVPQDFNEKISCTFDPENCKRVFYDNYNLGVHIKSFHEGKNKQHI